MTGGFCEPDERIYRLLSQYSKSLRDLQAFCGLAVNATLRTSLGMLSQPDPSRPTLGRVTRS